MSRHTPRSRDERTATPLSADDARPLVDDPALPGVHKVLSRAGLQDWLSDALDQPCIVTPRRLRYKAGTSAVLGFDLTTVRDGVVVTEACLARAYADHAAAKIEKLSEKVPADACLARDDALRAVVTTAAGDRALPLLPALGRPDGAARLLDRLFPETSAPAQTRLHTVRHNPGRRWVGVLERDDAKPLLLRAYGGREEVSHAATCYRALRHVTDVRTPRLVATARSLAVMAVRWVEGSELTLTGAAPQWRAAGSTLARLHESPRRDLPPRDVRAEAAALMRTAHQVAGLLPELSAAVLGTAATTARLLEQVRGECATVHGDFSADQVVVRPDGRPVVIDLDAAHRGASAYDVGCLTASTLSLAEAAGSPWRGEHALADFFDGYDAVRRLPDRYAVGVHTVAFRIRKAVDPFRDCAPDWREQVAARVAAARAALDDVSVAGSRA